MLTFHTEKAGTPKKRKRAAKVRGVTWTWLSAAAKRGARDGSACINSAKLRKLGYTDEQIANYKALYEHLAGDPLTRAIRRAKESGRKAATKGYQCRTRSVLKAHYSFDEAVEAYLESYDITVAKKIDIQAKKERIQSEKIEKTKRREEILAAEIVLGGLNEIVPVTDTALVAEQKYTEVETDQSHSGDSPSPDENGLQERICNSGQILETMELPSYMVFPAEITFDARGLYFSYRATCKPSEIFGFSVENQEAVSESLGLPNSPR